jgi:hemoglobin/transferrin/lactoferrin receptor protein
VVTRQNGGEGYIQGVELQGDFKLTRALTLFGNGCWTEGYVDTFLNGLPTSLSRESASRIQPLSGLLGIRWESPTGRWWAESTAQLARRQDRLSPGDRLDTQRIPPGGTKGYQVFGVRAGWRPCRGMDVTAGLENMTNLDYRVLGSGVNEPGTNFTLAVRVRF